MTSDRVGRPTARRGSAVLDLTDGAASNAAVKDWTGIHDVDDPRWADFRAEVERASRGRTLESLVTRTPDGLGIEPVYIRQHRPAEPAWSTTRGQSTGWSLRAPVLAVDPAEANRILLQDLERGADGAVIVPSPAGRGADRSWPLGVELRARPDLGRLLEGVHLGMVSLAFDAGVAALSVAASFIDWAERSGVSESELGGCLGVDWTSARARLGALPDTCEALTEATVELARAAPAGLRVARVDGSVWAEAGASGDQQIAGMLADATAIWRAWAEAGLPTSEGPARTELRVSLGSDVLESVATLRALRRCFSRIVEVLGADGMPSIEGLPNRSMLTRWDVHTNQLRLTAANAAGAIGGVDAMVAVPLDLATGDPQPLARRLARNLQHILREESHLAHVIDPAGGSYYVEARTEALAEAAWARFQRFEAEGGLSDALETGRWQDEVRARREARFSEIAHRKAPIVGISVFPNPEEKGAPGSGGRIVDGPSFGAVRTGTYAEIARAAAADEPWFEADAGARREVVPPLPAVRWSELFESLRDRAAALREAGRDVPCVFLANLGRRADFSARATWVENLLVAGGFDVVGSDGFDDPDAAARAFGESGARFAIICGSDELYEERGADFVGALDARAPRSVVLAGPLPAEIEDAPLLGTITAKDDAYGFLERLWALWEEKNR